MIDRLFDGTLRIVAEPFFARQPRPTWPVGESRFGFRHCYTAEVHRWS